MTRFSYPLHNLLADYLRAMAGLAFCLGLLLFTGPVSVIFAVLLGLCLLFAWLVLHSLWRQQTVIVLDGTGIRQSGRWLAMPRGGVAWDDLEEVRLRYYSTRRDRSQGWFQATIQGRRPLEDGAVRVGGGRVRVDSDLDGFDRLMKAVLNEAMARGLALDAATLANAEKLFGHSISGFTGREAGL